MPHDTSAVTNALLSEAWKHGGEMSHMKLHKILYYTNGYYLGLVGKPAIDRTFEAWKYGPVVPWLYYELRHLRSRPIKTLIFNEFDDGMPIPVPEDGDLDKVMGFVWETYGAYTGLQLSNKSHKQGSPWHRTRESNPGIKDADIPNKILYDHFKKLIKKPAPLSPDYSC